DEKSKGKKHALESAVATTIYWILMLFVFVIVLDFSGLEAASEPLYGFLNEITAALPKLAKAGLIFAVAWLAAYVLRKVVIAAITGLGLDRRFDELSTDGKTGDGIAAEGAPESNRFAESAGKIVYWVLLFFGFAGAVDALQITVISEPLRNAVDSIVSRVPQFGIAILFFIAGWFLARVARGVVTNLLDSIGLNGLVERLKLSNLFGERKASGVAGLLLQFFIVFNAAILALDQVGLFAVSQPLQAMMTEFWLRIPPFLVSALVIFIAVILGRIVRGFISTALDNAGFNALAGKLGMAKVAERQDQLGKPSDLAGFIAQTAIVLLATAQAF